VRLKVVGTVEGVSIEGLVEYDPLDDVLGLGGSASVATSLAGEKWPSTLGRRNLTFQGESEWRGGDSGIIEEDSLGISMVERLAPREWPPSLEEAEERIEGENEKRKLRKGEGVLNMPDVGLGRVLGGV